jgi:hypothetical protein
MRRLAILRDRVAIALVAAAVVAVGVLALFWPVRLDGFDRWGFRVGCGTGLASSYDQATLADRQPGPAPQPEGGYVDACRSAVLWRRAWAVALVGVGGGGLTVLLGNRERRRAELNDE